MSRDFLMIKPIFWNSNTARKFRGCHEIQLVSVYVMTCMSTHMTGLYRLTISTIMRELGMTREDVADALIRLSEDGFLKYDFDEELIWVVNMAQHQMSGVLAPKDNKSKSIKSHLGMFGSHPYVSEFAERYPQIAATVFPAQGALEGASEGASQAPLISNPYSLISDPDPKSKSRAKKPFTLLPEQWSVAGKLLDWCAKERFSTKDIQSQAEYFRDNAAKKALEYADWDAAFRTWMRKSVEYGHIKPMPEKLSPPSKASPPKDQTISSGITHPNALDDVLSGALFAHVKH